MIYIQSIFNLILFDKTLYSRSHHCYSTTDMLNGMIVSRRIQTEKQVYVSAPRDATPRSIRYETVKQIYVHMYMSVKECRVRIFPYRSSAPLYIHMCTREGWGLGPQVLPYVYIECTTIRARAANKHCLTLIQLRFLQYTLYTSHRHLQQNFMETLKIQNGWLLY